MSVSAGLRSTRDGKTNRSAITSVVALRENHKEMNRPLYGQLSAVQATGAGVCEDAAFRLFLITQAASLRLIEINRRTARREHRDSDGISRRVEGRRITQVMPAGDSGGAGSNLRRRGAHQGNISERHSVS